MRQLRQYGPEIFGPACMILLNAEGTRRSCPSQVEAHHGQPTAQQDSGAGPHVMAFSAAGQTMDKHHQRQIARLSRPVQNAVQYIPGAVRHPEPQTLFREVFQPV